MAAPIIGAKIIAAVDASGVPIHLEADANGQLKVVGGTGTSSTTVQGPAADGAAVVGNPVRIGGKDGSGNTQDILTDIAGVLVGLNTTTVGQDGVSNAVQGFIPNQTGVAAIAAVGPYAFNGTTWDRARNASAAAMAGTTQPFNLATSPPGNWSVTHTPAAGSQATASKAAGAAGVRHVVNAIHYSAVSTTAPALTQLTVNVRDGATGAGTVIWTGTFIATAAAVTHGHHSLSGLNIVGSAATAMTIEFSAGTANIIQVVSMSGWSTI